MNIQSLGKSLLSCAKLLYHRIKRDRIKETASSLTYQTVLALVPLLAILLGIAKGFSLDTMLEDVLKEKFTDHEQIIEHLLTFSKTTLEQMKSGLIAGLGVLFLLITTTNLLGTTETAMNRMWGVTKGRSLVRRIADFQSCLFLFPLLVVIGSSTTIFIQTMVYQWSETGITAFGIGPLMLYAARLLPLISLWIVFSLCYWLIPYVPIKKRYALSTAAVITLAFTFIQYWYIYIQLTLTKISVIYGSFAALPLFLVWLWISWLLFLVGAELMVFFHEQGWRSKILKWKDSESTHLLLSFSLFSSIVQKYRQGSVDFLDEYARTHEAPIHAVSSIIQLLHEKKLIYIFSQERKHLRLVPTYQGLHSGLGDVILPSIDHLEPQEQELLLRWKKLLNVLEQKDTSR